MAELSHRLTLCDLLLSQIARGSEICFRCARAEPETICRHLCIQPPRFDIPGRRIAGTCLWGINRVQDKRSARARAYGRSWAGARPSAPLHLANGESLKVSTEKAGP